MDTDVTWTPKARAVLAAADELFYAHGIHAVGVDVIAAHAGVTKKTLYDRFESKERLVVEYLRERDRQWRDFLGERLERGGSGVVGRLDTVLDASADWTAARSGKGCSMINAHAEISDPAHPAFPVIVGQKAWMADLFRGIVADTGRPDTDRLVDVIMLLHEGALVAAGMGFVDHPFADAKAAIRHWVSVQ
ncbi:TetR family transcriptional regulator [Rhodococcus sp. Leaf7]|uniref:TetR/AcrR family transcriptional regulator n=1 Tax=unclassified Rhodococcus (in: high G+C Gram-positive bacteria) TaxID=192944 RepID=UPI0007014D24|nr:MULTISPECIES: TetR/AcrR family transcriptional regulator [unclassified Rhodococcus (in: high G+C Gram-positive bacteria)]KQU02419.1 TetR family transcriptional regulator [Rhodococcus sp. Leaf7]KQU37890.1 TetR family transcriptional regulator [Rhodococcus sp. Leaf247]